MCRTQDWDEMRALLRATSAHSNDALAMPVIGCRLRPLEWCNCWPVILETGVGHQDERATA